ncbi:hypothetical protein RKD26_000040 [Streptomyces calvus]|uniref:hypothetical protein n=1 Tax=Streptomyces calvus TaxID=67282 RepID=UPI003518D19C
MDVAQVKARTADDLPDPPRAMTLAERRKQVAKDRHELSPMQRYMNAPERTAKGTPHGRPDKERIKRGPAAETGAAAQRLAAAPGNPVSVSAWATAYPGMLSIGGQVKLPIGVHRDVAVRPGRGGLPRRPAGGFVHLQEQRMSTGSGVSCRSTGSRVSRRNDGTVE